MDLSRRAKSLGAIGYQPDHRGIGGVQNRDGEDVDVHISQHGYEIIEPTDLVLGIDDELTNDLFARVGQNGFAWVGVTHGHGIRLRLGELDACQLGLLE